MSNNLKNRVTEVLRTNKIQPRTPENDTTSDTATISKPGYSVDMSKYSTTIADMVSETQDIDKQNTKIFGLPHQFLETADIRVDNNNNFGYQFLTNIYAERPIVTLMPGKMIYLPDYG